MAIRDAHYAGSLMIDSPKGIWQAAGDTNVSPKYAYRAENMRTERGLLATSYGTSRAFPALGAPIETLERFHRRTRPDDPEVFVAGAVVEALPGIVLQLVLVPVIVRAIETWENKGL